VLSSKKNEMLARVGPGTPCGNLMRRYWHPIYPEILLRDKPVRKVRILGENLTLYRDAGNRLGLIAERCPHRRTSLSQGIPEAEGLRCCYHGWLFNAQGECLEMPLEPSNTRMLRNIKIAAYPVQAMGGLIWAYLGPAPAPAGLVHSAGRLSSDRRSSAAVQLAAGHGESRRSGPRGVYAWTPVPACSRPAGAPA
jgi:5,5'-dehydrodivanillate O-demethylase